ncbi:MAG: zinc ribbon domain-containing protein [Anaerolineae bacterium]|nr:zinc ribbon domain-containing protein [Anaerolineae bacterium]
MPSEIQIPSFILTGLQVILAFGGAFFIALWLSLIIWTYRDVRARSRDIFAIMLATLMVVIFGPLGLIIYFLLRPPVTLAELYERSLEEEALLQDLEERPRCPGCSRQVKDEWVVCPDCHTTLKKVCPNCRNSLHLNWNVCPFCGTHVAPLTSDNDRDGRPVPHDQPVDDDHAGPVVVETKPAEISLDTKPVEVKPEPNEETFPPPVEEDDRPHPIYDL